MQREQRELRAIMTRQQLQPSVTPGDIHVICGQYIAHLENAVLCVQPQYSLVSVLDEEYLIKYLVTLTVQHRGHIFRHSSSHRKALLTLQTGRRHCKTHK